MLSVAVGGLHDRNLGSRQSKGPDKVEAVPNFCSWLARYQSAALLGDIELLLLCEYAVNERSLDELADNNGSKERGAKLFELPTVDNVSVRALDTVAKNFII